MLRSLARRIHTATREADELECELLGHVRALAPALLDEAGVGPIVAAQLIVAWSHHGRLRSEACFARLAGVAPVPASSGQTVRHRLSRGGDRQLNRALHTVVLHRRQHHQATKDYIAKRIADGSWRRRDSLRFVARNYAQTAMNMRYRVFEPETPRDLPLELVQEWQSEIVIEPGMSWEMDDGEVWYVSAVEPDPDQTFAGRVFFARRPDLI